MSRRSKARRRHVKQTQRRAQITALHALARVEAPSEPRFVFAPMRMPDPSVILTYFGTKKEDR